MREVTAELQQEKKASRAQQVSFAETQNRLGLYIKIIRVINLSMSSRNQNKLFGSCICRAIRQKFRFGK